MTPILLIDADYIVYSAGFATEKVSYLVRCVHPTGAVYEDVVDSKAAAVAWQNGRGWPLGTKHSTPTRLVDAEPVAHAKFIATNILRKIKDRALVHFGRANFKTVIFLTGSSNFRDTLATIKPYKGNRAELHKPIHYQALRNYLAYCGAWVTQGREADDAVATMAHMHDYHPERVVIAAVDKDLWTVPGVHYNFQKDEWDEVSHATALANFYKQLLTGDPIDNVGGCFRVGAKKAETLITEELPEQEMYVRCLHEYELSLAKKGCPYGHMSASEALLENARLLHMQRHPQDLWLPPASRVASLKTGSCKTSKKGGSTTSTSRKPSRSPSRSRASSAGSVVRRKKGKRATPPTCGSPGSGTTSS